MARDGTFNRTTVTIGGRHFLVDLAGYERAPVDSGRVSTDQGAEPGEQSLSSRGAWKRSSDDFIEGAGQKYFDHTKESHRNRFRSSFALNPWVRRELRLLSKVRQPTANGAVAALGLVNGDPLKFASTNQRLVSCSPSGTLKLYWVVGGNAYQIDDPTKAAWALTPGTGTLPLGANITSVATDGTVFYLASGSGGAVIQKLTGTVGAAFGALKADVISYCNGRLLASNANDLFEVDGTGAKAGGVNIYSHFNTSFRWSVILGAPNGIYCGGNNGKSGEVYLATVADQAGAITAPFHVGSLPLGETLNDLKYYGGVIILATSKGVRIASISGSGFLAIGPLIPVGGTPKTNYLNATITNAAATLVVKDNSSQAMPVIGAQLVIDGEIMTVTAMSGSTATVTRGVEGTTATAHSANVIIDVRMPRTGATALECQGEFVWFTWQNPDPSRTGLGRLNLAHFTDQLLPAYALDVVAPFQQGSPLSPVTWTDNAGIDRRLFCVSIDGPWAEFNEYADYGDYRSGAVTFGTPEAKGFVSLDVWCDPLPAGAQIVCSLFNSAGTEFVCGTISTTGARHARLPVPATLEDEWAEVRLQLYRSTALLATPIVQRWTVRAVPLPTVAEEIKVPVILTSEQVDDGVRMGTDPYLDWQFLAGLRDTQARTTYVMGKESLTVRISGLSIEKFDPKDVRVIKWTRDRKWFEGTVFVNLLTVDGGT